METSVTIKIVTALENNSELNGFVSKATEQVESEWENYLREKNEARESMVNFIEGSESLGIGSTTLLTGPMRTRKSHLMIEMAEYFESQGLNLKFTKSSIDIRDSESIRSYNGKEWQDFSFYEELNTEEILEPKILFIDEGHFIKDPDKTIELIELRNKLGKHTVLATLDKDFRREEFPIYKLMKNKFKKGESEYAENFKEQKLTAICAVCMGKFAPAEYSQILSGDEAGDSVQVEAGDVSFEPRCHVCHVPPVN